MIIGGSKKDVIENIKKNVKNNELNKKAELNDPVLTSEEMEKTINHFFNIRKRKTSFAIKNKLAYKAVDEVAKQLDSFIELEGLSNLDNIEDGAIITSNHFNPIDNIIVRKLILNKYHKNMYIVIQDTNLAMPGKIGFLMNYLNNVPISKSPSYINKIFTPYLKELLDNKEYILIYPEEEMWFNYRKPRPCKRGAYQFAAENNKPIISCFVEIQDLEEMDNDEFSQVKYIIHVLKTIYPDASLSIRENSIKMAEIDYNQKKEAYEKYYGKALTYDFSYDDIAGYRR